MSCTAAVLTISDKGSRGERADTSGPAIGAILEGAGFQIAHTAIIPDEGADIQKELIRCALKGAGFAARPFNTPAGIEENSLYAPPES